MLKSEQQMTLEVKRRQESLRALQTVSIDAPQT